jgi:NAD(P)-dependent dehydrogenase (short-subunit alcohol dehydrogenase family)
MKSRTVMITGANSGIGKATALELAKKGGRLILACRREAEGRKALVEIQDKTGNDQLNLITFDLSSQHSVRKAAETIRSQYGQLDVLINNAGFMGFPQRKESEDGIEMVLATNHLGPFMLTLLLSKLIMESNDGRIINLTSYTHRVARIDWDDFQFEQNYQAIKAYAKSKLLILLFTRYLAQKLSLSNVSVNAVDPGTVYTSIDKSYSKGFRIMYKVGAPFMASAKKGASSSVYLASDDNARRYNGELFKNCRVITPAKNALNEQDMEKSWLYSLELTGLTDPFR